MKRIRASLILTSILCAVFLASCQAPDEGRPQSSAAVLNTNVIDGETTITSEIETSTGEETTTQGIKPTTTASKETTITTKTPTTTTQETTITTKTPTTTTKETESTVTPTTYTKPFHERYSENVVIITIKDEYVDFDKQYTAKDFPGVDIKEVEITNYEKTHSQSGYIVLNKAGEAEVRKAVDILLKNPLIESAAFDPVTTTE